MYVEFSFCLAFVATVGKSVYEERPTTPINIAGLRRRRRAVVAVLAIVRGADPRAVRGEGQRLLSGRRARAQEELLARQCRRSVTRRSDPEPARGRLPLKTGGSCGQAVFTTCPGSQEAYETYPSRRSSRCVGWTTVLAFRAGFPCCTFGHRQASRADESNVRKNG